MTTEHTMPELDRRARAYYRDAEAQVSARTMAELHRRRISVTSANPTARSAPGGLGWQLAGAALAGVCALAIGLGWWQQPPRSADAPASIAVLETLDAGDALEALDALDILTLTALDEDSDFFLWLAAHEASLLAME